MKNAEDEAFDDLAKRQGDWGGGYQAKREAALDKLVQEQERLGLYDPAPQPAQKPEREALKLALEALEADELDMVDDGSGNMVFRKEQSITAIKAALAQLESEIKSWGETHPRNPSAACSCEHWQSCVECRPTAHAQPAQEPVAYLCENAVGHKYFRWKKPSSSYKPIPLYTTPPQRPWVGLTDEEAAWCQSPTVTETWKRIEAKLKEKNT